jgi:2-hydroxychromene-2-carboxylate isomerase
MPDSARKSADEMPVAEFWYEFASTYSYPAAMRVAGLAKARRVALAWRPFLLGPIFAAQGWRDSPFNIYPAKGRYMWRDLDALGLPLKRPEPFPQNSLLAAVRRSRSKATGGPIFRARSIPPSSARACRSLIARQSRPC